MQLPNGAKLVVTNGVVSNAAQLSPLSSGGAKIQPKPATTNPVVFKVVTQNPAKQNVPCKTTRIILIPCNLYKIYLVTRLVGQPLMLSAEEFAALTQQALNKPAAEPVHLPTTTKVVRPTPANGNIPKPVANIATTSPSVNLTDSDVSLAFFFKGNFGQVVYRSILQHVP